MVTRDRIDEVAEKLLAFPPEEGGEVEFMDILRAEDPLIGEFFLSLRGVETVSSDKRKDLLAAFLIDSLGGNSAGILDSAVGVPGSEERRQNQSAALERRLAQLVGPRREGDPRSLAEIRRETRHRLFFAFWTGRLFQTCH